MGNAEQFGASGDRDLSTDRLRKSEQECWCAGSRAVSEWEVSLEAPEQNTSGTFSQWAMRNNLEHQEIGTCQPTDLENQNRCAGVRAVGHVQREQ